MPTRSDRPRRPRALPLPFGPMLALLLAWSVAAPGCQIVGLVGVAADIAQEQGSTRYPADYEGIEGNSYAVVVSVDRLIEADHPGITTRLTSSIDRYIYENAGAAAHVPPAKLLAAIYADPSWQALPRGQLGEKMGVDRLIVVEMIEYRLHEPGNRYTWDGVASGIVEVYEIDSGFPDDPMYDKPIAVAFPDLSGILEEELPREVVTSELSRRFAERVAWLFYPHEERNDLTY